MIKICKIKLEPRAAPNAHVNLTDEQFITLITEINVIDNSDGCWLDVSSSRHFRYDCEMFKTYTNKKVLLGVAHNINVVGIGEVEQSPPLKNYNPEGCHVYFRDYKESSFWFSSE